VQVDNYQAMALFNRLDLAPSDWSNCGEFRIVYEHVQGTREAWLIFEAKLPNPLLRADGAGDPLGCKPALDLWARLPGLEPAQRAEELARFYYEGEGGLAAVVRHANYATGSGQVRTNHIGLGGGDPWQLREFRADNDAEGESVFSVDTVKGNALAEFYSNQISNIAPPSLGLFLNMQNEYLRGFVDLGTGIVDENGNGIPDRLEELLAPELDASGATPVIGGFGLSVDNQFNEFVSMSNASDNPSSSPHLALAPGGQLQVQIDDALGQDVETADRITVDHVLNRIDSQTCGGCHKTTSHQEIAPGVLWPADHAFVHARITGLSEALVERFLPGRQEGFVDAVARFAADQANVSRFDFNSDGLIDGADFGVALSNWGQSCGDEREVQGDFNGDCVVDGGDLGMILSVWGRKYFPDAPTTLRSLAPGVDTEASRTRLEVIAARVAEARTTRQREAALNRLRNERQAEEERQRALEGAFMTTRPVH